MNSLHKIVNRLQLHFKSVAGFFVIFYAVGITGMLIPSTFPLFKNLIPLALLLSFFALGIFHTPFFKKDIIPFFLIYILGFLAEVVGVNTGLIFGHYSYGGSLGIKLFNTPLMIGINWLLLIYISFSLTAKLKINPLLQIIFASIILLIYDLIIEQVAPVLDMWTWSDNEIPIKNYIAWFILAFIFSSILKISGVKTNNKLAPVILLCQLVFFIVLFVTFKFRV